jgi:hypothetical protein
MRLRGVDRESLTVYKIICPKQPSVFCVKYGFLMNFVGHGAVDNK